MKRKNIEVLSAYLEDTKDWVSAEELAAVLHTTTRTVRNYIKDIRLACKNMDEEFILSSPKGYRWNGNGNKRTPPIKDIDRGSPEERIIFLLKKFSFREYITLDEIIEIFHLSDSTIEGDIIKTKEILKENQLTLKRKGDCYYLIGRETNKRSLLAYCLYKNWNLSILNLEVLEKRFSDYDVKKIYDVLMGLLQKSTFSVDGFHIYSLLFYIFIQLDRISVDAIIIEEDNYLPQLKGTAIAKVAECFMEYMYREYGIRYDLYEKQYLTQLIFAETMEQNYNNCHPQFYQLKENVSEGLEIISNYIHYNLLKNNYLECITCYIKRVIFRQRLRLYTYNPIEISFGESYPILIDAAIQLLTILAQSCEIRASREEVTFLAMVIGRHIYGDGDFNFEAKLNCTLICPQYFGLMEQLSEDITRYLGNSLRITSIIDTLDINESEINTDIVLTVIPFRNLHHSIIINPFLKSSDFHRIRHEILKIKTAVIIERLEKYLKNYLSLAHFEVNHFFSSKRECIHYICDKVNGEGISYGSHIEEQVLFREEAYSTAFKNIVAVPHVCTDELKKDVVYLIINKVPMSWGTEKINILIFLAFRSAKLSEFHYIYDACIRFFSNPGNVQELIKAESLEQFFKIFNTIRSQFL